jgi:hypothetical protein
LGGRSQLFLTTPQFFEPVLDEQWKIHEAPIVWLTYFA